MHNRFIVGVARKLLRENKSCFILWALMQIIEGEITKSGIWFWHKHDTILWYYPWKRRNGFKYITMMTHGCFNSLKEIDEFWEDYEKELAKTTEIDFIIL